MAPLNAIMRIILLAEDYIVAQILRSPGFHKAVRGIHRKVEDYKYGRDPNEPLRQGEASEEPGAPQSSFLGHFIDELRNQFRGTPTNPPPPGPPKK